MYRSRKMIDTIHRKTLVSYTTPTIFLRPTPWHADTARRRSAPNILLKNIAHAFEITDRRPRRTTTSPGVEPLSNSPYGGICIRGHVERSLGILAPLLAFLHQLTFLSRVTQPSVQTTLQNRILILQSLFGGALVSQTKWSLFCILFSITFPNAIMISRFNRYQASNEWIGKRWSASR